MAIAAPSSVKMGIGATRRTRSSFTTSSRLLAADRRRSRESCKCVRPTIVAQRRKSLARRGSRRPSPGDATVGAAKRLQGDLLRPGLPGKLGQLNRIWKRTPASTTRRRGATKAVTSSGTRRATPRTFGALARSVGQSHHVAADAAPRLARSFGRRAPRCRRTRSGTATAPPKPREGPDQSLGRLRRRRSGANGPPAARGRHAVAPAVRAAAVARAVCGPRSYPLKLPRRSLRGRARPAGPGPGARGSVAALHLFRTRPGWRTAAGRASPLDVHRGVAGWRGTPRRGGSPILAGVSSIKAGLAMA